MVLRLKLPKVAVPETALTLKSQSVGDVTFHKKRRTGERDVSSIAIIHPGETLRVGVQRPQDPPNSAFPLDLYLEKETGALQIFQPGRVSLDATVYQHRRGASMSPVQTIRDVESVVIKTNR